ncbi:hypothetical protein [Salinarchaeum laminariae]|uniref:hypothetical protein n=1 Tax=Salinarchaeum laminariae TaxID=869888 RepID=UPI0020BDD674|nr:hypothetical protein [Salinarchaeum laminariae]
MSEDAQVRCWLVERDYWDEDVVTLVYATPDGEQYYQRQLSGALLVKTDVTAATTVEPEELETTSSEDRERYATEAERVAASHDPDDLL